MEELKCPHCETLLDEWTWNRFAGLGVWKEKNQYWGCPNCHLRFDGSEIPEVIDLNKAKAPAAIVSEFGENKHY